MINVAADLLLKRRKIDEQDMTNFLSSHWREGVLSKNIPPLKVHRSKSTITLEKNLDNQYRMKTDADSEEGQSSSSTPLNNGKKRTNSVFAELQKMQAPLLNGSKKLSPLLSSTSGSKKVMQRVLLVGGGKHYNVRDFLPVDK